MKRRALMIQGPGQAGVVEEDLRGPAAGELLVRTLVSAVSAGTELLFYRGQVPTSMKMDKNLPEFQKGLSYPLCYGYASVGKVVELGAGVSREWLGKTVFSFSPHRDHQVLRPKEAHQVPEGLSPEAASLFPTMETAVNLAMDGGPLVGENVVVFGQGVVGLVLGRLLARVPGLRLFAVDAIAARRERALAAGAEAAFDPRDQAWLSRLSSLLGERKADLVYEVSGNPQALEAALACTGFGGRLVVGSWYGSKPVSLALGGDFHRDRIRIMSSQVSTVDPGLSGRWDKDRRYALVWRLLGVLGLEDLISHRVPFSGGQKAYSLLDENPAEALQVVIDYA